MFDVLIKFVFWLIMKVSSLIFTPIIAILTHTIPNLGTIIENIQFFMTEYVFHTLKWMKMFLINVLAFPPQLLNFLVSVFMFLVSLHASMLIYKGAITLYQKLKP